MHIIHGMDDLQGNFGACFQTLPEPDGLSWARAFGAYLIRVRLESLAMRGP